MIEQSSHKLIVEDQTLILLPEKAMFWENEKGLIISDVHLGKAGHFRKNGIALPQSSDEENLKLIDSLIDKLAPVWILFLGDLFHSEKNDEWESFVDWRATHNDLRFILVMGNHELYPAEDYSAMGIECMDEFQTDDFLFVHDENEVNIDGNQFVISGHIHPAIRLKGKGRQSVRIPCFYFEDRKAILPAFGKLTGTYTLKSSKKASVFGILDDQILQIQ